MTKISIPADLDSVLDDAWNAAKDVPGFLTEAEGRFLGMAAACAPAQGGIVEIGSFKGKSTVILGKVAQHYGLEPVTAIDPHNFNSVELGEFRTGPEATSYTEFVGNINAAGVSECVRPRRAFASDVAKQWTEPIRFLWIDGDHSYAGAKADFDGFMPHVLPGGVVALHDALHEFAGPIKVFVEQMLRSDQFGAAGFVGSIAWAQFRPGDGAEFRGQRAKLEQVAARLVPYVTGETKLRGLQKLGYKLSRSRVKRGALQPAEWARMLDG